jgi:broad specificity phosphatase PhoE
MLKAAIPRKSEPELVIHLVGHAPVRGPLISILAYPHQPHSNLTKVVKNCRDPSITEEAFQMCRELKDNFPNEQVTHIICSPLSRALNTAKTVLQPALHKVPIRLMPELQSAGDEPWNVGRPDYELYERHGSLSIDYSLLVDGWSNKKVGKYEASAEKVLARVQAVKEWLIKLQRIPRDEGCGRREVVVVSHSSILRLLFKGR